MLPRLSLAGAQDKIAVYEAHGGTGCPCAPESSGNLGSAPPQCSVCADRHADAYARNPIYELAPQPLSGLSIQLHPHRSPLFVLCSLPRIGVHETL